MWDGFLEPSSEAEGGEVVPWRKLSEPELRQFLRASWLQSVAAGPP